MGGDRGIWLPATLHPITWPRPPAGHAVTGVGESAASQREAAASDALVDPASDPLQLRDALPPPLLRPGDALRLGPLFAMVTRLHGHPRLIGIDFRGKPDIVWAGIARHGRPIQYAHVEEPLSLWDGWTKLASLPVAFEPPSASFVLDWSLLTTLRNRSIEFVTLTHAAGISSTGDPALDARLPFDETYRIPASTVRAIRATRQRGGRVIAIATTVTRPLEHAAARAGGLRAGDGLATQRIGWGTRLRVVDAIVTGAHECGERHYELLLRAFAQDPVLSRMSRALEDRDYLGHEFGDSVLLTRSRAVPSVVALEYERYSRAVTSVLP